MRTDYFLHVLDEVRLNHIERVELGRAHAFEVCAPVERRTQSGQFLVAQLVVDLLGIAAAGLVECTLGQAGFNLHDHFGFCRRFARIVAEEGKHLRHMLDVFLPQFDRFRIVFEIVITVGHAQSALIDLSYDLARVLKVGSGIEAEQDIDTFAMQAHDLFRELFLRLDGRDALEVWLQGFGARFFDGTFVHATGVVVADLLLIGASAGAVGRRLLENVAHDVFAALLQFVEAAPAGAVGGNRVLRLPLAAGVGVKIVAGIDTLIEQVGGETDVSGRLRDFRIILGRLVLGKQDGHEHDENGQHFQEVAHEILEIKMWYGHRLSADTPSHHSWTKATGNGQRYNPSSAAELRSAGQPRAAVPT